MFLQRFPVKTSGNIFLKSTILFGKCIEIHKTISAESVTLKCELCHQNLFYFRKVNEEYAAYRASYRYTIQPI